MKISTMTLNRMVLLTVISSWGSAFATAAPAPVCCPPPPPPPYIKTMSVLPPDGQAPDYSRQDMTAALINYEAAARMQEYEYNQQLLFMGAPGSTWAIQAGSTIGQTNSGGLALTISDSSLVTSLGPYSKATKTTLHGSDYTINPNPMGPLQFYEIVKNFFVSGDSTSLGNINIASILEADNLNKQGSGVTQAQAQTLVNIIADPFPYIDPILQAKIKNNKPLTGEDMEALGSKVASYAVVGVSVTALSDIISRRIPANGQTKSIMEVMDDHSQERFKNANWYSQIGAASEAAVLREIAHMMAYNQWVAYEQFRVSEQQLALLASMNAIMSKMNVGIDQMNRQMLMGQAQGRAAQQELKYKLNQSGNFQGGTTTTPNGP